MKRPNAAGTVLQALEPLAQKLMELEQRARKRARARGFAQEQLPILLLVLVLVLVGRHSLLEDRVTRERVRARAPACGLSTSTAPATQQDDSPNAYAALTLQPFNGPSSTSPAQRANSTAKR